MTGDVTFAGTNAKVFIQIYGDKGKTEIMKFESRSNNDERNSTEIFKVSKLRFYPMAERCISGCYSDWQIKTGFTVFTVKYCSTDRGQRCGKGIQDPCRSRQHGDRIGMVPGVSGRQALNHGTGGQGEAEGRQEKEEKEDEDEDGGEVLQEVVMAYHFPCSRWLASGADDDELVVEVLPEGADELEGMTTDERNAAESCVKHV